MDLKAIRLRQNLTMQKVSEASGITEGYYSMIENNERRPSVKAAKTLGTILGIDWTLFFEEEEHMAYQDKRRMDHLELESNHLQT